MTDQDQARDEGEVVPGGYEVVPGGYSVREGIQTYTIGLVLAAFLTVMSFLVVRTSLIWGPGIPVMLAMLAIAQMGVHLVFFLHMTTAPDNTNNVLALAFGVLIVMLVIVGSLWIMDHLNSRLMPTAETMRQMM